MTLTVVAKEIIQRGNCDTCAAELTIHRGQYVCSECGLVHGAVLTQKDFVKFDTHTRKDTRRKLAIDAWSQKRLYTNGTHTFFKPNEARNRGKFHRLLKREYQFSGFDRFSTNALFIERICDALNISDSIQLQILHTYYSLQSNKIVANYNSSYLAVASLIKVCRENKLPILIKTILNKVKEFNKSVSKQALFRFLIELGINTRLTAADHIHTMLDKFHDEFPEVERRTFKVLNLVQLEKERVFMGCRPQNFCAGVIYFAYCEIEGVSQKKISRLFGLGEHATGVMFRKLRDIILGDDA